VQQESLAELLTREQGKPLSQSREEIVRAASLSEAMVAIPIEPEVLVEDAQRHVELRDIFPAGVVNILAGGEVAPGPGYFIAPTIITDLPEDARLIKEEQFGPLLPVLQFSDVGDAIRRANDTRYGLAASVCRSVASRNPASDAITPSSD
jgi:acyl-CoA reductase-like NAD-dependent aldehyde dehydrogenase